MRLATKTRLLIALLSPTPFSLIGSGTRIAGQLGSVTGLKRRILEKELFFGLMIVLGIELVP